MQGSNIPQYGWKCLNRTWISLNISEFSLKGRVLNMSHIQCILQGHSPSWWLLIERWVYSEIHQRSKVVDFGKTIVPFDYFHKTLHLNLWQGPKYVLVFKHVRVLSIPGLLICQGSEFPWLHRVYLLQMAGFWICISMQLWKGSKYSRILAYTWFLHMQAFHNVLFMAEFWICLVKVSQGFEYASCCKYARA